jgi:hypothetical protein
VCVGDALPVLQVDIGEDRGDLGGGTVWLTPAQAAQFVKLRIGAGFAESRS